MLNENNLVLCGATIGSTDFGDLVKAASIGGFDAISLMAVFYEDALSKGLTVQDMQLMLDDNGLLIAEVDALLSWLPGAAPDIEASNSEKENYNRKEDLFFEIASSFGAELLSNADSLLAKTNGVCFNLLSSILYLFISLAFSSESTTTKSSPADAELFMPKISTGVDGNAKSIV